MTDTTRDLIQRLANELDHYKQLLMDDRRKTHPLANEARAALAQPEPQGPTLDDVSELCEEFGFHLDESYDNLESAEALWEMFRAAIARWGK
jgi:hypothetical protein